MVVNEEDVINIMGGMEHAGGIRLNDHKRKLKNRFEIRRKLGQGTYGKVQLGINKETSQEVAIKTIKKSKIETEADLIRIRREIQIMSSVQHPNIIHIYEVFENKEKMVLVMEIAAGGELYDFLSERKCLEENEARRIFRQIATAVYYCHKHNICHRDLKLENILLDENGCAKIADFGLSNVYDGKNLLNTFCGSPLYASPEIVKGNPYAGPEVDCWSLGVLLYTLVYGAMPFDGSNFKRLVKQITTGDYYEPKQPSAASHLIRTMLTVGSDKRANIADICSHWWVNDGYGENSCLQEAEYLAGLTPVRLDLLLSLAPPGSAMGDAIKDAVLVEPNEDDQQATTSAEVPRDNESAMSIVELPPGTAIPDGAEDEASEVSISEPPDEKSPSVRKRKSKEQKAKRKMTETPTLLDPDLSHKKRSDQVQSTPPEMRSEHSKNRCSKGRSSPRTPSRNSPLQTERSTPTSGIDSASSKLDTESSGHRRKVKTTDGMSEKKTKSPTPTRTNKEGRKTPVKRKKEVTETEAVDKQLHPPADQYPQISPDLQRKPPPKPKAKKSEDAGDDAEVTLRPGSSANRRKPTKKEREIRERNVRTPDPEREPRERNVITPDPVSRVDSGFEDNDSNATFERPCPVLERPPTPRQPRAPSPEERPLVVPLPPPRIPNASTLSTQQFNPTVPENSTGHQIFCSEEVPPPLPERPISMQVDPSQVPNLSADFSSGTFSRNVEPPPVPERPQLASMPVSGIEENNQKKNTAEFLIKEVASTSENHHHFEDTKAPIDLNRPSQANITQPSQQQEIVHPNRTDLYSNVNIKCSKTSNNRYTESIQNDTDNKDLLKHNNETKHDELLSGVQHRREDTMEKSDRPQNDPLQTNNSIPQGSNEDKGSCLPMPKPKTESNSKSVIIPQSVQPKQQLNNSSISSDRMVHDSFQSQNSNDISSSASPSQSKTQTSSSGFVDCSPIAEHKSGDANADKKNNFEMLVENENKLKDMNKVDRESTVQVESTSTGKTHTITLEMPKIEPKAPQETPSNTTMKIDDTQAPNENDLILDSNESRSKELPEPSFGPEFNEKAVPTPKVQSEEQNQKCDSAKSISGVNNSSVDVKEKVEKSAVISGVDAIINPAPKTPPKKQPEKKVSIKQQLQQAALQKLQQQQARHAARQANVEKVTTTTRPKTPQTFGNTPVSELQKKDNMVSKPNEGPRDTVPPASMISTSNVTNDRDSTESRGSSAGKQDDGKSLINSVPKPFKPDGNWTEKSEPSSPHLQQGVKSQVTGNNDIRKDNTSDSVASAISLSSSGSEHSMPHQSTMPNKMIHPEEHIKRPFDNLLTSSPGGSSSSIPKSGQRDSKVIKAAQYWNNFIGEKQSKPAPETTKPVDKPKKIISAGVGQKGYNDLKTAFEQKNKKEPVAPIEKFGIQRRNSKKLNIDGCQPGLRVNDALSVFESKNQPSTPVIYRRNSVKDGGGGQPKWSAKHRQESGSDANEKPMSPGPITVMNKDDIENLKLNNSAANSPEAGKGQEKFVHPSQKDTSKEHSVKNERKEKSNNIPNGVLDNKTSNGLDKGHLISQMSNKNSANQDVLLQNKINDPSSTLNHRKDSEAKADIEKPDQTAKTSIKQESSPKIKIKKDHNKTNQGSVALKQATAKPESTPKSPKIKPFKPLKDNSKEKNSTPNVTSTTVSEEKDTLGSVSPSVISPNQAARNSELEEAKLSAKDVIAREVFKVDAGSAHVMKQVSVQSPKTASTDEEEFVLRPGTKSLKTDSSKVTPETKEVQEAQNNIQPANELEAMKNSLKKVEVAPMMRKGLSSESGEEHSATIASEPVREPEPKNTDKLTSSVLIGSNNKQQDNTSVPSPLNKSSNVTIDKLKSTSHPSPSSPTVADSQNITTNNLKSDKDNDIVSTSKSTRIIPIKIERDTTKISESQSNVSDIPTSSTVPKDYSVKENKKGEHYIPIMVEGKGMINNAPITSQISKEDQDEANEKFDSFHSNSLSRRRFGSRKKRMSSAYSDSSGISDEGSELGGAAFSGLQRFSSLGKHGLEENIPVLKLRKTRPPFTMQRSDSCSSGEDDFDDDGFREMTAENLFSTLLTRVKSLTRRIHDEHESDLERSFKQNQRILNHPLNPGGTHARLERSLQRNSIKRDKPPTLSRQSSTEAASRYSTYDDGASSVKSYGGGSIRGENDSGGNMTTAELMRKYGSSQGGGRDDAGSVYSSQSLQRGTRASPITVLPQSSIGNNNSGISQNFSRQSSHDSISNNRPPSSNKDRLRKSSRAYLPSEREMINRLYREAAERTSGLADTFSDGYDEFDTIGSQEVDELSTRSDKDGYKARKRGYLRRLDEENMDNLPRPNMSRHVTRRSISRELFNDDPTSPLPNAGTRITSARPVTKRSMSRELQNDPTSPTQVGRATPTSAFLTSPRRNVSDYSGAYERASRERSLGRDDFVTSTRPYSGTGRRSESLTRGTTVVSPSSTSTPSRASLASQGRSLTQNEFGMRTTPKLSSMRSVDGYSSGTAGDDEFGLMRPGSYTPTNLSSANSAKPSSRFSTNLEDRTRSDWRRTSVPERGKDFKSLPRKYNRYSSIIESMPSFWNTPSSSSTSAAHDFPDQFSPTSSNASPFRKSTIEKFSDLGETRRSQSQAGMMEALMSPRQVLSPSSSKIIHPSQSASFVGGVPSGYASRYLPRQISLDNSQNYNHENKIPLNKITTNELDHNILENNIPHELNFVTLRRPPKRLDKIKSGTEKTNNELENQFLRQSIERQDNHFPLRRQTSGSSSTSTQGNLNENETPVRSGLDHNILKDKSMNERQNRYLNKNGSNYSSFCSTFGENEENSISETQ